MIIQNNVPGKAYNTFGLNSQLSKLIVLDDRKDLAYLRPYLQEHPSWILGGGSNILIEDNLNKPVVRVNLKGIQVIKDNEDHVLVSVMAGENWHELVLWSLGQDYGGLENLSLIPGRCGAAPMQNIGAYGIELKDVLHTVHAYHIEQGLELSFHNQECGLGYRTSNFKTKWKGQYLITEIVLRLTKIGHHVINTSYGAIEKELAHKGITEPTIKDVSNVVCEIRKRKLPDPEIIGNAGSFFKNPIIERKQLVALQEKNKEVPFYEVDSDNIKIPAAWLIDQCGWKGKVVGGTGTHKNQPLVLVNHGTATGSEIYALSEEIKVSVASRFGIELEREVNVWSKQ